jgi:hypothetical protein
VDESIRYAFIDESGTTTPFGGDHFLVVAALTTAHPRSIETHVKRAHKKYGTSLASGEMKASASQGKVIERMLRALADEPLEFIAIIVDKRVIVRPPTDAEDIYRAAVTRAAQCAIDHHPLSEICLDKRYTTKTLWDRLERQIRSGIADRAGAALTLIRQEDSIQRKELQAVDYVAWAIYQKYARGVERFYRIIAAKIVIEEIIQQRLW